MTDRPALLGGTPAFPEGLAFVRPTIEDASLVLSRVTESLDSGMVTNAANVRDLETRVADAFRVEHFEIDGWAVLACRLRRVE